MNDEKKYCGFCTARGHDFRTCESEDAKAFLGSAAGKAQAEEMDIRERQEENQDLVSAKTHVFIGMFRPTWEKIKRLERFIIQGECRCGESFRTPYVIQYDALQEHYLRGCFDEPVYKTHDEVIEKLKGLR